MDAATSHLVGGDEAVNSSFLYCLSKYNNFSFFVFWTCELTIQEGIFFFNCHDKSVLRLLSLIQENIDSKFYFFSSLYYSGKFQLKLFFFIICYIFYVRLVTNLVWDQKFLVYKVYSILIANEITHFSIEKDICVFFSLKGLSAMVKE